MPNVDRIFVNKFIKQRICQTATGDRAWLNKLVRLATGHDAHFHVRLLLSARAIRSASHKPSYYSDDGCGEPLDLWFRASRRSRCLRPAPCKSPPGRSCRPPARPC
jgi:penicillin-insensitive murein endopeptidase